MNNKISKAMDAFQKKHWSGNDRDKPYSIIIGITSEQYNNDTLIGFIKTANINLNEGKLSFELTENPKDAFLFDPKISTMIYHYFDSLTTESQGHQHYPVRIKK